MTLRTRLAVVGLFLLALLSAMLVLVVAGAVCPQALPGQPCPDAGRNQALIIVLVGVTAALLFTPFLLLGEYAVRRRIAYRGAWLRAARRGAVAGLLVAAFAALRLGAALSWPAALFFAALALAVEWLVARRFDA